MRPPIHVHETVSFDVTLYDGRGTALDLAGVPCTITLRPPGGPCRKLAAHVEDACGGIVSYETTPQDLDRPGLWRFQVCAELPARTWCSEIVEFQVQSAEA